MRLLEQDVATLRREEVPFALIGAGALAVHGASRSTLDIDLPVVDPRCLARRLWSELRSSGADVDLRIGDADDPLAGVVRVEASGERTVDAVVGRFAWQARLIERSVGARLGGTDLPVVRQDGLVLLKLFAGGFHDTQDVALLLEISEDRAALVAAVEAGLSMLGAEAETLWRTIFSG